MGGLAKPALEKATFAGGCFWCMEAAFEHVPGVQDAISGYTGGTEQHPTYDDVSNRRTSQAEAIRVIYNPSQVTYDQLLDVYWRRVDPTGVDRAFSDVGRQYRSVIFVHDAAQREAATRTIGETTIYFCSTHCAEAFDADPARYGHPHTDGEHHHEPTPAPHHH